MAREKASTNYPLITFGISTLTARPRVCVRAFVCVRVCVRAFVVRAFVCACVCVCARLFVRAFVCACARVMNEVRAPCLPNVVRLHLAC